MRDFFDSIFSKDNFRLHIIQVFAFILFAVLVLRLFNLQIRQGDYYSKEVNGTALREIDVAAPRGNIYDRYGRALAVNKTAYAVNLDPSVGVDNMNDVLVSLIKLLEENNEKIVIDLPITSQLPHEFLFSGSETKEKRWKSDMNLDEVLSADECFNELKARFDIGADMDEELAAKVIALRCSLYLKRYTKYVPIPVAYNISDKTASAIKEQNSSYPCVYVDYQSLRDYPYAKYLSHILGYIGNITDEELTQYKDKGYDITDVIGKDGIEKAFEANLNGTDGVQYIEVDSSGRRISTLENEGTNPVAGNDVYLTIDAELQKSVYDAVENALRNEQIERLTKGGDYSYSISDVFKKMITSDNIHIRNIMNSKEGTTQYGIKSYILQQDANAGDDLEKARELLLKGYRNGAIAQSELILALYEQGQISDDDGVITQLKRSQISGGTALIKKLQASGGDITPQMTGMDPCTASVVVTDVNDGSVLAAVTYPSYDNNELVNDFNNEYYLKLQSDPTTPMVNRPFTEPRAPGSTFKMITATAALQEGFITPYTTILDKGTFTDAGKPYARCWIGSGSGSHGSVNVSEALEVSCNYFFYTVSYMMGRGNTNATMGIDTLNKYMTAFGLNDKTGVEIYELYDSLTDYPTHISSPDYKKYITLQRNPDAQASEYKWTAGDTIRTAIGQSYNNYTSATMSKYVATLANGGTRYKMHLLDKVTESNGTLIKQEQPTVESTLNIDKDNLNAIFEGMLMVTSGDRGTLRNVFKDYPIKVAAKSGTAQESEKRSEHTTFVAFAPYEDPKISIAVFVPFGNGATSPSPHIAQAAISNYLKLYSLPTTKSYNTLLH